MVNLILHSLAGKYGEVVSNLAHITGKKFRRIISLAEAAETVFSTG
jgi:hypothetical protein